MIHATRRSTLQGRALALVLAAFLALLAPSGSPAADLRAWSGGATPPLALPLLDGGRIDLGRLRGKVVLVNFWATWCAPCIKEMPSLQRLAATLPPERFAVIAVNYGETEERVRAFLRKLPIELPIALDPKTTTARDWGAKVLPVSFVVDRDGRIRYDVLGDLDWSSPTVVEALRKLTMAKAALGERAERSTAGGRRPPTLASLAAPGGGEAFPWDGPAGSGRRPPTLASLAAPGGGEAFPWDGPAGRPRMAALSRPVGAAWVVGWAGPASATAR